MNTRAAVRLVEADRPRAPAILETLRRFQFVEQTGPGGAWQSDDGQGLEMRGSEPGCQSLPPTDHRPAPRRDASAPPARGRFGAGSKRSSAGRSGSRQIGKPGDLRHEPVEQIDQPFGAADKAGDKILRLGAAIRGVFEQPAFGAARVVSGRHPDQCQKIRALEMRARFFELRAPFGIDEGGGQDRETRRRGSPVPGSAAPR